MNNHNILLEAERVFYAAMLAGWAGDVKGTLVPNKPGFKQTEYRNGDFRVLDEYGKGRGSNLSSGTTTIWYFDEPVWVMTYGGSYREDEIPFLKKVLIATYTRGIFRGCRGDNCAPGDGSLVYTNSYRGDFRDFEGIERIFPRYGHRHLGHHWYRGMTLLPVC